MALEKKLDALIALLEERLPQRGRSQWCAVTLDECCRLLCISRRRGERLLTLGRFPIPALPPSGEGHLKTSWRFSTYEIDVYLREASLRESPPRVRARLRLARSKGG